MTKNRMIISGLNMFAVEKWQNKQALLIEADKIIGFISEREIKKYLPATCYEFPAHYFLAPGFIDLHVHGVNGKDVMDDDINALPTISSALACEGVTGFLATTMTAPCHEIEYVLQAIKNNKARAEGAKVLGIHLEGPFISATKKGAQGAGLLLPDLDLFQKWQHMANHDIKLLTLAPELMGALTFIESLKKSGVVVALGHTDASYEKTHEAIHAGGTHATHLFNAMRGMTQREPGALGALLDSPDVIAEVIADGFHVHPAMLKLAFKMKGSRGLVLVSDSMRAKSLGDGEYTLGGQQVQVKNGKATLSCGTLAGSTLQLPQAIKNMCQFTACTLIEAITMATVTPARVLGLKNKGEIKAGFDADLVVLNENLQVVFTLQEGRIVFENV